MIVADDEEMTRLSSIRAIQKVSNELSIRTNIIEAEDGVEVIYLIYKSLTKGIKISIIISDENMNFLNGSKCSEIIREISSKKHCIIPFYLVTAYEFDSINHYIGACVDKVFSKPLSINDTKNIFFEVLKS